MRKGAYSSGRQTHGHIAVNMIYGHMNAKTEGDGKRERQTHMGDIVCMNVRDGLAIKLI